MRGEWRVGTGWERGCSGEFDEGASGIGTTREKMQIETNSYPLS